MTTLEPSTRPISAAASSRTEVEPTTVAVAATVSGHHIEFTGSGPTVRVPAHWLRDRSTEPGQIEPTNRQRLFTPVDLPADLTATACSVSDGILTASFSDGHTARFDLTALAVDLGWLPDPDEPPAPEAWTTPLARFPYVDWRQLEGDGAESVGALLDTLDAFYRHGYVVVRNLPTEPGSIRLLADRFGYLVGNNFGEVFEVRVEKAPTDLAYTSVQLLAHTDQPYRRPIPGIQILHCLTNGAPGGDSTLVDGLAAAEALAELDPEAHRAMVDTEVVYRYDMGTDTVVNRGRTLEYSDGRFVRIRFNTKLDSPVLPTSADLDAFYRGRRLLTEWLNNPDHQVTFRLEPGDAMFMDNHRVLHGRTAFDSSKGTRHLQGCYIDHDGPDTRYRLAMRALRSLR